MPSSYVSPAWFIGYDAALELLFGIISVIISVFAFNIHRKSGQEQAKSFASSFLLIALSYFAQATSNFLIISKLNAGISQLVSLQSVLVIDYIGMFLHMILMIIGLSLLLNIWEGKNAGYFTALASTIAILGSSNPIYTFYLLSAIFLFFLSIRFFFNYLTARKMNSLLILLAFLLLLASEIHFFMEVDHPVFYATGHFLQLAAYLLIIANFYLVSRKKKK